MTTAAARWYGQLAPIGYDDDNQGNVLQALITALVSPREILELTRDQTINGRDYLAWEAFFDPDTCPGELLDWLAVFSGVELPASALTDDEKRYRIKQAAGRYRGTPRAIAEELQLVLTGTKTVLLGFNNGDRWHYLVGTIDSETPDPDAVARSVAAQKPAFMIADTTTTGDWSWFVLAPDVQAHRATVDGVDSYVIDEPTYPTWQDVVDHFSTWQHLLDNDPDL